MPDCPIHPAALICHVPDPISQVPVLCKWQRLAAECWQELKLMQDVDNERRKLGPDHAGAGAMRCERGWLRAATAQGPLRLAIHTHA